MTKEKLKEEAEKYADGIYHYKINDSDYGENGKINYRYSDIKEAYLASAEPREKQIQIDAEQIRTLQKQNGELTDKVKELQEKLEQAEKVKVVEHFEAYGQCRDSRRIAELEAQIEKMRNCRNCKKNCEGYRNCTLQNLCYWEWDNGDIH